MSEQGKRLLKLKDYKEEVIEETVETGLGAEKVLDLVELRKKKQKADAILGFESIKAEWNPNDTLRTLRIVLDGQLIVLDFVWDSKDRLERIIRR